MYCSGCGQGLQPGQAICPRCGRPVAVAPPPVPGFQFQLDSYSGKVRVLGFVGMEFARAFMFNRFGPWGHWQGPFRPEWFGPAFLHFLWVFVVLRALLLFAAGWGLMERAPWGRIVRSEERRVGKEC